MERFQYLVIIEDLTHPNTTDLVILGQEGWELTSAVPISLNGDTNSINLYFKKKVEKGQGAKCGGCGTYNSFPIKHKPDSSLCTQCGYRQSTYK